MQPIPQLPIQRFFLMPKFQPPTFQKTSHVFTPHRQLQPTQSIEFDGKRLRKAVTRKTVDYNSSIVKCLESRVWQRDYRDRRGLQPDSAYYTDITPPLSMPDNPINAVTTKFVRTSTNKMRCPIFCVAWTPEGRRLVTGASSGEFTLWNGLTFNFETILQAHDSPVRCMVWSHNDIWMVTGDHAGYVKYWQSNMNNVKMFQAHKEAIRGISFCPVDSKFTTCSDDGTVRIWDFLKCFEEKILRGHGADVKCVDWHPQKALIVSGSKDSQQPIKLWDPKSGQSLATIHVHKNTVMDAKWNKNGNWLLTASRDHLIKLFDIRNMKEEMQTFRGHKKEATTVSWHPVHESLFASGGSDGSIMFWAVGADKEVGAMEQAHDSCVWSLAWHPIGHILCSGSNDHTSKFWTRNRPGDRMRDKYNLNTLPKGQEEGAEFDDTGTLSSIPGMGLEYGLPDHLKQNDSSKEEVTAIPGLDLASDDVTSEKPTVQKKVPFSKPIPKQFQQQWMDSKQPLLLAPPTESVATSEPQPPPLPPPLIKTESAPMMAPPPLLPPPPMLLPPPPDQPLDQKNQFRFPMPPMSNAMGDLRMRPPHPPNPQFPGPRMEIPNNAQRLPLEQNQHHHPPQAHRPPQANQENYDTAPRMLQSNPYGENFQNNPNMGNPMNDVRQHQGPPPPQEWGKFGNEQQMPRDMSQQMPRDMQQKMHRDMPQQMHRDMPQQMPRDMPQHMPRDMPQQMPRDMPQQMPRDIPQQMPRDMPQQMPRDMPQQMPRDMPQQMPRDMPQQMPRDMPQQMPRDMPMGRGDNRYIHENRQPNNMNNRQEGFPDHRFSENERFDNRPHNMGRGPPELHQQRPLLCSPLEDREPLFDESDVDLRSMPSANNHHVPPPLHQHEEEMNFNPPRKTLLQDRPSNEHFPPSDHPPHEFRGPPPPRHQSPQDFGPRYPQRGGGPHVFRGRGQQRGAYNRQSPYRMVRNNRGRGGGGGQGGYE